VGRGAAGGRGEGMRSTTPHLSVVVPAYNEAGGLDTAIREIRAHVASTALPFTIVVVDDGSTDGSWKVLCAVAEEVPELRAIRLSRNFGKEAAIAAGLEAADGDAAIILDADLQHPPRLIP